MRRTTGTGLIALVALASFLVSACGFGADQPTGRVGETIKAGDYQLTLSQVDASADRPDRFTNSKPGNKFVKAHVKVENTGSQHLPVASNYFSLRDSGGIDNPALSGVPSDTGLKATSIGPGQSFESDMYFEMAANLSPVQIVLAPVVVGWRTRIAVNLS
jgi:hypothetical protein